MRTLTRAITLSLLLCIPVYAAVPPMPEPAVKRPAPLLSPRHASAPKATPMRFTVAATENPVIPMMVEIAPASDGRVILIVDALKPANTTMVFEYATHATGPWEFLISWSTYPEQQWVGVAWTTQGDSKFVRATHGMGTMMRASAPLVSPPGVVKLPPTKTKPKRLQ